MKIHYVPRWAICLLLSFSLLTACKKEQEPTLPTPIMADSTGIVKHGKLGSQSVETMYANLYVVWFDNLYVANTKTGAWSLLAAGYQGSAKTIAEDGYFIWVILGNGNLLKVNRFTGKPALTFAFGTGAVGVTGEDPQGFLYAQQGTRLWKINKLTGTRTRLGGVNALENWTGTQALYYHNKSLYIIWKNTLYRINRTTGLVEKTYPGVWSDVKGIAAPYGSSESIYIVNGTNLFRIYTATGAVVHVKQHLSAVTAMSGADGNLFIVSGDILYRVSESGDLHFLSNSWKGATSMGAIRNIIGLY